MTNIHNSPNNQSNIPQQPILPFCGLEKPADSCCFVCVCIHMRVCPHTFTDMVHV